jgi:hypothetical protein
MKKFIKTSLKEYLNENIDNSKLKEIEEAVEYAKTKFMSEIEIFKNINFEWLKGNEFVGEYQYNSSLDGEPTIYLYKDYILSLPDEEIEFAVNTTIFHELGHAMVNIDNYYIFKEDDNILHYEDEEDYVEEFAFDFEMFGKVPNDILELSELFKNKKWIGTDENYDEQD